ncbi:hypothetical protein [Streptomyces mobaraensis]|uniref:Uncharacterized protein n=1 Tax=Streptomyces mobaraensis TaxID=35621 RepID=A0A5N5W429_STRMB|nr:hypothetical protein [Streptomyces mobaraensis]KAB7839466.1 hypothetical protein FRZ00_21215 [Streptomyces mobaraensis]
MDRIYMNRIDGQRRIHIEIHDNEVSDLIDDLIGNLKIDPEPFAATHAFLSILRTAEETLSPVVAEGRRHRAGQATGGPDPTTGDDPIPLRWGHGDVLHGDDDTTIVCLSGPNQQSYWLELEPERVQALRDDLLPPAAEPHVHPAAEVEQLRKRVQDAEEAVTAAAHLTRLIGKRSEKAERSARKQRSRAEIAETELHVLRSGLRASGADPTQIQNLWAQIRLRNRQWREEKQRAERAGETLNAVRTELAALNSETAGLNPYAVAGRRDAVARVHAALDAHTNQGDTT